ncbi:MAG: CIA30 family protein [Actinomycetota bacterium]
MTHRLLQLSVALAAVLTACGGGDAAEPEVAASLELASSTVPAASTVVGTDRSPPTTLAPSTTSSPSTTLPPSTVSPTTAATDVPATAAGDEADCVRIADFDDLDSWVIVNDGVMGGRSAGQAAVDDSVLRFSGSVVTAGGGFTSIRLGLAGGELAGSDRLRMRLRPDTRTYGLTLADDQTINGRRIAHGADLPGADELDDDGFAIVELPYSELEPTVFGQLVLAEPFRPDAASEIGIIIADGVDGPFALDVDWIDACG